MTGSSGALTGPVLSDTASAGRQLAERVAEALQLRGKPLVFAESCTAGWCAAWLSAIPGISSYLCGSLVTYQNESKASWLGVSAGDLANPAIGPVSETVARQMLAGALACTPQAEVGGAVTGHLGPQAPAELDGVIYVAVGWRGTETWQVTRHQLQSTAQTPIELRGARQQEAVRIVYEQLLGLLGKS